MKQGEKMEETIFIQDIINQANAMNVTMKEKQAKQFYEYMLLLLEWNQKMNLTAITNPQEIMTKHFVDSITILTEIEEEKKVIDIGTGAGFPGIPIKIMQEKQNITLLDSLQKRITFLQEVIQKLNLQNMTAVHERVEEFAMKNKEAYDIVTSRAVAKLNVLAEYMLPLTKIGGKAICMKANNIEEELKEAKKAIEVLGGTIEKVKTITLPNTNIERNIVVIQKEKNTPKIYPRKAGIPSKKPII